MKKIITIMLVIAMCLFVLTPYTYSSKLNTKNYQAFSATEANLGQSIVITLYPNNPIMTVNGIKQEIDPGRGTAPVIIPKWSRTVVPIRAIVEAIGGTISWDGTERKVTINLNDIMIELWIDNPKARVNGNTVYIDTNNHDVKPIIVNSRTMLPLRFVAENLGCDVQYNNKTREITLTYIQEFDTSPKVQKPDAPILTSPMSGSTLSNANATFEWSAIENVDFYKLQITKDGLAIKFVDKITTNSYTLFGVTLSDGTYTWQVAAHNSAGWSEWSTPFVFIISTPTATLLPAPTLVSPESNLTFTDSNITFTWSTVAGVDLYKIQILEGNNKVHTADNITTNSYSIQEGTLSDGTYTWQVAAHNSAGWSEWSTPFVFIISAKMSVTDIAKFVDRVVFIQVNGYEDGKAFTASGSGFIISNNGEIATNYHVIDGAVSGTVTLNDGTKYNIVSVLGYGKDKQFGDNDIAVIRIDASNLPVCKLGDSNKVEVGESVVTIGSPLGLQNSVSDGIVSKIWNNGLIQITAPISHGSSGGPLFNMYGEVIGINTYGLAPIGGENINVAIPVNWLKTLDTSLNMTLQQVYEKEHGAVPSLPAAPSLISPADNAVLTTLTPTFSWTSIQGADYYGIAVMKGTVADTNNIVWDGVTSSTSITIPTGKLQNGQTYTWLVTAHNSFGFSNNPEIRHFSVSYQQLSPPVLLSPEDKKSIVPSLVNYTLSFTWTPVVGASSYVLWIGSGLSGANSTKVYQKVVMGTSLSIPSSVLQSGEIYTWSVGVLDGAGNPVWSNDRHFSIVSLHEPVLLYPDNYATIYTNPEMIWLPMLGADSYELLLYEGTTTSSSTLILSRALYDTKYTLPPYTLTHGETYSWCVGAFSNGYLIGLSDTYVFTVAP
jgi:hypothetical protein